MKKLVGYDQQKENNWTKMEYVLLKYFIGCCQEPAWVLLSHCLCKMHKGLLNTLNKQVITRQHGFCNLIARK